MPFCVQSTPFIDSRKVISIKSINLFKIENSIYRFRIGLVRLDNDFTCEYRLQMNVDNIYYIIDILTRILYFALNFQNTFLSQSSKLLKVRIVLTVY